MPTLLVVYELRDVRFGSKADARRCQLSASLLAHARKTGDARAASAKGVAALLSGPPTFKRPRQRTPICLRKPT
jgi:hypothetical protein